MISSPSRSKDKHIMEKTSFLRRLAALAPVLLALVSCAPQAFVIRPEMRTASKSGLNLMGKSMGVVYLTGKETAVNEFNEAIADVISVANKRSGYSRCPLLTVPIIPSKTALSSWF